MPSMLDLELFFRDHKKFFSHSEQLLLFIIASINGTNEEFSCSTERLIDRLNISRRQFNRLIKNLVDNRLILSKQVKNTLFYNINPDHETYLSYVKARSMRQICPIDGDQVRHICPSDHKDTIYIKENKNLNEFSFDHLRDREKNFAINDHHTEKIEMKKNSSNRFEEFWSAYPRKVAKKRALSSWVKNDLDDIADFIISHLKMRVLDDQQWQNKQFIPHPATFLNAELWNDEYLTIMEAKSNEPKLTRSQQSVEDGLEFLRTLKFVN